MPLWGLSGACVRAGRLTGSPWKWVPKSHAACALQSACTRACAKAEAECAVLKHGLGMVFTHEGAVNTRIGAHKHQRQAGVSTGKLRRIKGREEGWTGHCPAEALGPTREA